VIHIFVPLRTQSSPSRLARVRIDPGSEPESGSVNPKQPIAWPAAIGGTDVDWDANRRAFVFGEETRKFAAIVGSPTAQDAHPAYETNYSSSRENSFRLGVTSKGHDIRLLVIAGYDAAPIDGVDGPKTQTALAAFLKSRGLTPDIVQAPNFFAAMIDAVQSPSSIGLTWCNDTPHKVMAAVGTDDGKTVISRGWYRIEPGKCLHPDVVGQPKQIFSFAEAVDADNRAVKFKDKPLNWGGTTQLCTRESKFEINEQGDCGTRGLAATGFTAVDMSSGGKTLRFAMP